MKATVRRLRSREDGAAECMMRLFAGNSRAHGTHGVPMKDGLKWEIKTTAKTIRKPVTLDLWRSATWRAAARWASFRYATTAPARGGR